MIFLGNTFCSGRYALLPPTNIIANITAIQVFNGVYSRIFLSTNKDLTIQEIDNPWDEYTQMNADFSKGIDAGNSGFSLKNTNNVVIKRRELGTYDWMTIYVREINKIEDFNIVINDTYARAGVEYEYCVSSLLNGMENSYVIQNVYSDFDGFYITDKDCLYGTIYDVDGCDTSRNITAKTLELLNSKYMTVVSNSELNCDSGSISGTFLKMDDYDSEINRSASLEYRNNFKNRLANKKPLILKVDDGRIWMIRVTSNPNDNMGGHRDIRQISFEWVEIGDVNDMKTLYMDGFSDVDSRWWV